MRSGDYRYLVYGLTLRSDFPIPILFPGSADPDVEVRSGPVPASLCSPSVRGVLYDIDSARFLLRVPEVATYLVSEGREIRVERSAGSDEPRVLLYLVASALGALLHQRGDFPLHGGTVARAGCALSFAGDSGFGKSTLVAAFSRRGYRVLSDDVSPVRWRDGAPPLVYPSYPFIRLSADGLDLFRWSREGLRRIEPGSDKFWVPVEGYDPEAIPLTAIYVLEKGAPSRIEIRPVIGLEKMGVLQRQTFRSRFVAGMNRSRSHFSLSAAIGRHLRVCTVQRSLAACPVDRLADIVEQDWLDWKGQAPAEGPNRSEPLCYPGR